MSMLSSAQSKVRDVPTLQSAILNAANYGIISTAPDGVVTTFNATAERWLGYAASDIVGKITPALWHDANEMTARAHVLSCELGYVVQPGFETFTAKARLGQFDENEWTLIRKDGSRFPASLSATALFDDTGGISGYLGVIADLTARKRAEEQLRESEESLRLMNHELERRVTERTAQLEAINAWLKCANTALKKSEDHLRQQGALFDQTYDGVIVWKWNGPITFWNRGAENLYGFSEAEAVGRVSHSLLQTEFPRGIDELLLTMEQDSRWEGELQHTTRDGRKITVESRMTLVHEPGRSYVLEVNRDVTKRKLMELEMRESEDRFRTMANSITQLAWIARADGFIHWYNRRWYEYTGTTPEQMEGWGWQSVHDPRMLQEVMENWTCSIRSGEPFDMEFPLRGADGQFRIFLTRVRPLKDAAGSVVQWFGTNTDVDELKRSEEKVKFLNAELELRVKERTAELASANESLLENETRIRLATEAAGAAVWAWNVQTGAIHWDAQMFKLYGLPQKSEGWVVYEDWAGRVLPEDLPEQETELQRIVTTGGFGQREFRITRASDNAVRYIHAAETMVAGQEGKGARVVGINLDITDRKSAEAKLKEQAVALKRSNLELEQFAYVASHDMREPLRAVSGFAQILKDNCHGKLDKEADAMIDHIMDGAKRMANIIDDLLALSRIGSQGKPLKQTELETPLRQAMENLSVAIQEKGVIVHHDRLPVLPVDASQLTLLFQNLMGNAIKFCNDRVPKIHIGATKDPNGLWTISVSDNGIGIEPKYFERIFGIFRRLHTRDEYPGTGIGLAICKKIVEWHGGRIWLESAPGTGTTFYFTLSETQKTHGE